MSIILIMITRATGGVQVGQIQPPARRRRAERKDGMKIKVNNDIVAEVRIVKKMVCRAGAAYWTVDYMIDGVCIHSAVTDAIIGFCEEMFEGKREVDPESITGNAFSSNGLSFSLKDGRKTYKVVYRNSMKVFEFFKESEI